RHLRHGGDANLIGEGLCAHCYPAWRSRNSKTSVSLTPGKRPRGSGLKMWVCTRALGHAFSPHLSSTSGAGLRQQFSSGQVETSRAWVSRPRQKRESSNGTPTVMECSPMSAAPVCVAHQKVPAGVSVY